MLAALFQLLAKRRIGSNQPGFPKFDPDLSGADIRRDPVCQPIATGQVGPEHERRIEERDLGYPVNLGIAPNRLYGTTKLDTVVPGKII